MKLPNTRLFTLVLSLALVIMVGWLLVNGKGLLLPIFTAIISVYILNSCVTLLDRQPLIGRLPVWSLRLIVLMVFTACIIGIMLVVSITVDQLLTVAPTYQENLEGLLARLTTFFGVRTDPTWAEIRAATIGQIDLRGLLAYLLASLTSIGGSIFLVVVYAAFLFGERASFGAKLDAAFPRTQATQTREMIQNINARIGEYLAVKTLINIILGLASFVIMWAMDVDFALFWAVMIGLMNYIPYVGSLIGVAFPVVLSLAQFGAVWPSFLLAAMLTSAQTFVGNVLEPRMIGRQLNLSPFVVLVALSLWTTLWGIPGAILAIPMTSMITIICAGFPDTRFIAILLAEKVEETQGTEEQPV
ncbi:AI-2E family transporter [Tropicimonas sp. TH_r6]|uniref:AI-2E family transporter n=1 Tax=Tropicimonas sp. TH_r6 TaxID=3082085 RepID=UPI002953116B|nr:AI-2E family transporter [Tropicimonas sp. TH_r6]MDV7142761.1 AI-2E family transporter [Tropicimonas sp. TH_r6]